MDDQIFSSEEETSTLIFALKICIKNGFLKLRLNARLVSRSMNKLLCNYPPKISISLGLLTDHNKLSIEALRSFLSKVKVRDLVLEIPGPDKGTKPGVPSKDEFFGGDHKQLKSTASNSRQLRAYFEKKTQEYEALKESTILYKGPEYPRDESESHRIEIIVGSRTTNLEVIIDHNSRPKFFSNRSGSNFFSIRLPPYLTNFIPHYSFDQKLDLNSEPLLPSTLQIFSLENEFNQPLDSLPKTLDELTFGSRFNHNVNHLPQTLTHLKLGDNFDQKVDNLPSALISLWITSAYFSQTIDNLPSNLKSLVLDDFFFQSLDNLPSSLEELSFLGNNYWVRDLESYLEESLAAFDKLPKSLKELYMPRFFNKPIDHLPSNLEILFTGSDFNQEVDSLPKSLRILQFNESFNQRIDHLPMLTKLVLGKEFNQEIDFLPSTLTRLTLGWCFNQKVDHLPKLISLKLGHDFNQEVNALPATLIKLYFGYSFNQSIDNLPPGLEYLSLGSPGYAEDPESGSVFEQWIRVLPTSLKEIHIFYESYHSSGGLIEERERMGLKVYKLAAY